MEINLKDTCEIVLNIIAKQIRQRQLHWPILNVDNQLIVFKLTIIQISTLNSYEVNEENPYLLFIDYFKIINNKNKIDMFEDYQ